MKKLLTTIFSCFMGIGMISAHSPIFDDGYVFDSEGEGIIQEGQIGAFGAESAGSVVAMAAADCVDGSAGGYPCNNIDLLSFTPKENLGGGSANTNDIWGWTDPQTSKEYAILGRTTGTSFIDVTDGSNPVYLGFLDSHNGGSGSWRDIKVYQNHAFIVAAESGNPTHGMQVFDLTQLRTVTSPTNFSETAHYNGFGRAHNLVINEDSGYAYGVGTDTCGGGLHMIDISNPTNPTNAGCFSQDGYTHDAQCVIYQGPDTTYTGREICFAYNEDTVTIVDVQNKALPVQIGRATYPGAAYIHQGWLTEDQRHLVQNDELDEQNVGHNTKSMIWDVSDLNNPFRSAVYDGPTPAIDHNLYIKDGFVYESNYRAGLRILDGTNIPSGLMTEVAYFDVIPNSNTAQFSGTWSNYAYFDSGNIIMSDIGYGLFVVKADLTPPPGGEYCTASSNVQYEWIGQVDVGSFSNSSSGGSGGYQDFTNQVIALEKGSTAATFTPGFSGSSYNEYWKVWIDFNQDGDFADVGEEVFSANSTSAVSGSITVPTSAPLGQTRMRVAIRYNTAPPACGTYDWGEIEDYTVDIQDGPGGGTCSVNVDFESGSEGWTNNASSTCSTGSFISGTPTLVVSGGVTTQLAGAKSGSNAFFSAVNTSAGVNDVDRGNCIVDSPVYNITENSNVSISYFHGQRDANDDAGDFFKLEISTNGGSSYTDLASNGDSTSNAVWTEVNTAVLVGDQVKFRVQVSDGTGPGDLIEAGVDALSICTP